MSATQASAISSAPSAPASPPVSRYNLPDVHVYDAPLWRGAERAIDRLAAGALTADEYQDEIAALFDRISPVEALADWTRRCLDEAQDQVLVRRTTPTTAMWFQLLHLRPYEVHPPHGHRNLISNQVVLHGKGHLREYDRVARVDEQTVLLKLRSDRPITVGDRIRTTEVDRNVHWFGGDDQPAVQLNFFVVGYQDWTFDGARPMRRGRTYFDPTGAVQADGMILAREIPVEEAEALFQNRPITDFPVKRPARP
jgi:hypothetical protein